jgi:YVTN family beta-propeller protein/VCBS repeat-containing protein
MANYQSQHGKKRVRRESYAWLGVGAVTLGMGAALAGATGVAAADTGTGAGTHHPGVAGSGPAAAPTVSRVSSHEKYSAASPLGGTTTAAGSSPTGARLNLAYVAPAHATAPAAVHAAATASTSFVPALKLVANVISLFGVDTTLPAAPGNPLAALVWNMFRDLEIALGVPIPVAGMPTATGRPDAVTGLVTGSLAVTDPGGQSLTYTLTTKPTQGTVTLTSTGAYTYTPTDWKSSVNTGSPMTDTFTVTATNGLTSTTQTVTLKIQPGDLSIGTPLGLAVGSIANAVAVSPNGQYVYLAVQDPDGSSMANSLVVVNVATQSVAAIIPVTSGMEAPLSSTPSAIGVSPDGNTVYVGDGGLDWGNTPTWETNVVTVNALTHTVTAVTPFSTGPAQLAVSPDNGSVYVANFGGVVSVINAVTHAVTATIPVGEGSSGVALSPDGTWLYSTAESGDGAVQWLSVIKKGNAAPTYTIPNVGNGPVTVSPDGKTIYVASGSALTMIDSTSFGVTKLDLPITGFAIAPTGNIAYAITSAGVMAIDTVTNTPITAVVPYSDPTGVAVTPSGSVFVAGVTAPGESTSAAELSAVYYAPPAVTVT